MYLYMKSGDAKGALEQVYRFNVENGLAKDYKDVRIIHDIIVQILNFIQGDITNTNDCYENHSTTYMLTR